MSDYSKKFANLPVQARRKDCEIGAGQFILQNPLKSPEAYRGQELPHFVLKLSFSSPEISDVISHLVKNEGSQIYSLPSPAYLKKEP